MLVLSPMTVDQLAQRVEAAYRRIRRGPQVNPGSDSRVWARVAMVLVRLNREDPTLPVDPELYVQAQGIAGDSRNEWMFLSGPGARQRYRRVISEIRRKLRKELLQEVRTIRKWIHSGLLIEEAVNVCSHKVSPMGRALAAHLLERADLAEDYRAACISQHNACPLYHLAWSSLLPSETYPVPGTSFVFQRIRVVKGSRDPLMN